jgi:hypothetical protein
MFFDIKKQVFRCLKLQMSDMIRDRIKMKNSGTFIVTSPYYVCKIHLKNNYDDKDNHDLIEYEHYEMLTKLIDKHTPHIVGMFKHYQMIDLASIFTEDCSDIDTIILAGKTLPRPSKHSLFSTYCRLYSDYKKGLISQIGSVIVIEYCPQNFNNFMNLIERSQDIKVLVHRIIFQIIYTLAIIQKKYPGFVHNDLFLRNVLIDEIFGYDTNIVIEYKFNNVSFYLPANGYYVKINDFGYSVNPGYISSPLDKTIERNPSTFSTNWESNNPKRDIYNFLTTFFIKIIVETSDHPSFKLTENECYELFTPYLDVVRYNEIREATPDVAYVWNIHDSTILQSLVKKPEEYFSDGVFKQFESPPSGKILRTYSDSDLIDT